MTRLLGFWKQPMLGEVQDSAFAKLECQRAGKLPKKINIRGCRTGRKHPTLLSADQGSQLIATVLFLFLLYYSISRIRDLFYRSAWLLGGTTHCCANIVDVRIIGIVPNYFLGCGSIREVMTGSRDTVTVENDHLKGRPQGVIPATSLRQMLPYCNSYQRRLVG